MKNACHPLTMARVIEMLTCLQVQCLDYRPHFLKLGETWHQVRVLVQGCELGYPEVLSKREVVQDQGVWLLIIALHTPEISHPTCAGAQAITARKSFHSLHIVRRSNKYADWLTSKGYPTQVAAFAPPVSDTLGTNRMMAACFLRSMALTSADMARPDFSLPFSGTITHGSCICIATPTSVLVHDCNASLMGREATNVNIVLCIYRSHLDMMVLSYPVLVAESHEMDAAVRSVCKIRFIFWRHWHILLAILQKSQTLSAFDQSEDSSKNDHLSGHCYQSPCKLSLALLV